MKRIPQRFQYRKHADADMQWGVCLPINGQWNVQVGGGGFGWFVDDPWEVMEHIIGRNEFFEWIDNDFGWETER